MTRLRAAVLTYAATAWDSRIQRIVSSLSRAGHDVALLSPDEAPGMAGLTRHYRLPPSGATRAGMLRSLALMAPSSALPLLALPLQRRLSTCRIAVASLISFKPDVIHANDWITLTAGADAARATGAKLIYDSHEFATEENAGRLWWRLAARPHIAEVERRLIGSADHVLTIGDGIAEALAGLYGARIKALTVVRNLPEFPGELPVRREDGLVRLAYCGLIRPERRLDAMIGALAELGGNYRLDITGFGPEGHIESLKRLALKLGAADRVAWHMPVPPARLAVHLAQSDIGLFLVAGEHIQRSRALPNKVFEYTAAGLALVAAGSHDVERLIAGLGNGVSFGAADPQALARALRGIGAARLAEFKALSRAAREELNWANESQILLGVYGRVMRGTGAAQRYTP